MRMQNPEGEGNQRRVKTKTKMKKKVAHINISTRKRTKPGSVLRISNLRLFRLEFLLCFSKGKSVGVKSRGIIQDDRDRAEQSPSIGIRRRYDSNPSVRLAARTLWELFC